MSNSESDWNDAYDQGRNDERTALLAAGYRKQVAVEGDVKVESTVAALREHAHGMLVDCTSEELADDAADLIESQQQRIRDLTERLRIVEAENDDCSETIMSQSRRLADKDATIARVRAEAETWRDSPAGESAPTTAVGEHFLAILDASPAECLDCGRTDGSCDRILDASPEKGGHD